MFFAFFACRAVSTGGKIRSINIQERHYFSLKKNNKEPYPISAIRKFKNLLFAEIVCTKFGKKYAQSIISEVFKLKSLQEIIITKYPLQYLDFSSATLENLEELNLENNHISGISKEIANLPNLKKLILTGNPVIENELKFKQLNEWLPNTEIEII